MSQCRVIVITNEELQKLELFHCLRGTLMLYVGLTSLAFVIVQIPV